MYRLGIKVKVRGKLGTLIGRVLQGDPSYDIRLSDGTLVKYVPEHEVEPLPDQHQPPARVG